MMQKHGNKGRGEECEMKNMRAVKKIREAEGYALYLGLLDIEVDRLEDAEVIAIVPSDREPTPHDFDDYSASYAVRHWAEITGDHMDICDLHVDWDE